MIRGLMRISIVSVIAAITATFAYAEVEKPSIAQKVDANRAKELALLGLADGTRYEIPWMDDGTPPDWWIQVPLRMRGSAEGRDLAVNSWTGDVWDRQQCVFVTTPALQVAVAEIKRSFSAAELKDYDRLHRMRGDCLPEVRRAMAAANAAQDARKHASAVRQNRILAGNLPKRVDPDRARLLLAMAEPAATDAELTAEGTELEPMIAFSIKLSDGSNGAYEVNPWTGGVWDMEKCVWLSTPALSAAENEFRQSFPPAQLADYQRARRLKMDCRSADRRWWARTEAIQKTLRKRVANERAARELIVLADPGATVASLDFEPAPESGKSFYQFQGLGPRVGTYGYFAVNPWTGDVWNMSSCDFPTTPAFRKAQARIRQSYPTAERWKYDRLHLMQAECHSE